MAEQAPTAGAGEVILLTQFELANFEEEYIKTHIGDVADRFWRYREPLSRLIKPRNFNGDLTNIGITEMEAPRDELHKQLGGLASLYDRVEFSGFVVIADTVTLSEYETATVHGLVWYIPRTDRSNASKYGKVHRVVENMSIEQREIEIEPFLR